MQEGARGELNPDYVRHVHYRVEDSHCGASIFDHLFDETRLSFEVSVIFL